MGGREISYTSFISVSADIETDHCDKLIASRNTTAIRRMLTGMWVQIA